MRNFQAHTNSDRAEMLNAIGVNSVDDLFAQIPQEVRIGKLELNTPMNEMQVQKAIKSLASKNNIEASLFIGGGAQKHFIPAAVSQIAKRFEFNTAYTPYQPEISQGTLQMIYEFQSLVCHLTGMDVANASMYDAGSAIAEALIMAVRIAKKDNVLVANTINPAYKSVLETYLKANDINVEYFSDITELKNIDDKYSAVLIQTPNYYGELDNLSDVKSQLEDKNALLVIAQDLFSTVVLKEPGAYGADIVVGDVQSMGLPLSFGGPYAGYMACLDKYKRQLPGRIVGRTLDADGKQAFTLTLQTREQHIKREKATSNICSNQGLCALCATVHMSIMGKKGLTQVASMSAKNAHELADGLAKIGFEIENKNFFNEFVLKVKDSTKFLETMKENNIIAGIKLAEDKILVCATEINSQEEIAEYIEVATTLR